MILYLHGFRSSPDSFKAQLLAKELEQRGLLDQWRCPQLPVSPKEAIELAKLEGAELAKSRGAQTRELTIVGSSLGGFYAVVLAEQFGCKAVLINPAVYAPRDLATQIGDHAYYHSDKPMTFLPSYVDELRTMAISRITDPQRYLLIAATGDELLDWREMTAFMEGANTIVVPGSDHGLSNFEEFMPQVLSFAGLDQNTPLD